MVAESSAGPPRGSLELDGPELDCPKLDGLELDCPELDCRTCAACCRGAFETVSLGLQEPVIALEPSLVRFREGRFELARRDGRCAALVSASSSPDGLESHSCRIYEHRPEPCRLFERGGRRCLAARRRLALPG